MDQYLAANRELWDTLTPIHLRAGSYDVEGFKQGKCSLKPLEIEEVGDVAGKTLLHLQCHFGLDTLSWARLGAIVTGADFSEKAIAAARALVAETGIAAEFICCDIYDLPSRLSKQFDVVFTSAGVLHWLPDKEAWGQVVGRFVKPGGIFYIREFHPFAYMFDDAPDAAEPRVKLPYFKTPEPLRFEGGSTYAGPETFESRTSYEWPFALSDVLNSLINAGLTIEFVHEFPYTTNKSHAFLVREEGGSWGTWRHRQKPDLPLMFSIRASKS